MSPDLARPLDQRFTQLYGKETLKVSHHPTKFGGHRHGGSGDIVVLVYPVVLQDHLIKGSSDFMGRSPST